MNRKPTTIFQLGFWCAVQMMAWIGLGCIGCLVMTIVLACSKQKIDLARANDLFLQDYAYVVAKTSLDEASSLNYLITSVPKIKANARALQIIPTEIRQTLSQPIEPILQAMLLGFKLLMVRLLLLLHWLGLFLLLGAVGLVDGIMQRNIRKAKAEAESALLFNTLKPLISACLFAGIFIVLILPFSISCLEMLITAAAAGFGITLQLTAKQYKKHI